MTLRIVIADDHKMFRHALRVMLERDPSIAVVGEAANGEELLKVARETTPDLVCMDVAMPGMNGIEATRQLRARNPAIKIIGLTAQADPNVVVEMLRAGAMGYMTKSETSGEELLRAVRAVQYNRAYLCEEVAGIVTDAAIHGCAGILTAPRLGSRERQVLQLVAEGHTSPEIARRLHLASSTVDVHRRNIMRKLNLRSVADLTKYAIRHGLTSDELMNRHQSRA